MESEEVSEMSNCCNRLDITLKIMDIILFKKEIVFTKDGLDKISARFEKNNLMGLIKCLKKY